ncbi:MAG: preprotein translocase subunit SecG [Anaplasmataceae bacterium]|nr:preprotein translocase subunit SecG [Anaplasmataceae bacterium]
MISIVQVIIAIALVILILLQERSSGLSGLLGAGGGEGGGFYQARRGAEKFIFAATIGCLVAFVSLSVIQLLA